MSRELCTAEAGKFSQMAKNSPRLHVLVVDDEPLIRWSMGQMLTDAGHMVVEAADAKSAISIASTAFGFDVILLDFRLPDSTDLMLLSSLRRLMPRTPIILMTAYGTAEVLQQALELGAYLVIQKPFEMTEIPALVLQAHARGV